MIRDINSPKFVANLLKSLDGRFQNIAAGVHAFIEETITFDIKNKRKPWSTETQKRP